MILCVGPTPTMQRTLVFGRLVLDRVNRASEVLETAAGKSVNVARVLSTLGQEVLATGFVGGRRGDELLEHLDRERIPHDFVRTAVPTRLCTTAIDQSQQQHTEMVQEAAAVQAADWEALAARIARHLERAALLVLSGSLPTGAAPDFYRHCVQMAREAGVPAIVDASGPPLRLAMAAQPALIKPNAAELAAATELPVDSPAQLRTAIDWALAQGAKSAVVTLGAAGAIASDGRGYWRVRPPAIRVLNSMGAGDAMTAGLALARLRGQSLVDGCRLGTALAAANCLTLVSGVVNTADVDRLLGQVVAEPLEAADQG